jgi:hypothetical protein
MSTDKTRDEAWRIQLAYAKQAGLDIPTEMSPEDLAVIESLCGRIQPAVASVEPAQRT